MSQFLTSGEPTPLRALFQQVKVNTTLRTPEELSEAQNKAANAAKRGLMSEIRRTLTKSKVGRVANAALGDGSGLRLGKKRDVLDEDDVIHAFEGFVRFGVPPAPAKGQQPASTGLDVYEEQILFVRNALQTYFDDPSESEALMEKVQTARTVTKGLIAEQEVGWRPVFESILWPPVDGASFSVTKAMAKGTGRSWCAEVVTPFEQTLRGLYPFDRTARDMSFEDFTAFYNPSGTLWSFYNDVLDAHVDREGDRFEFTRRLGRTEGQVFNPALLRFLERSRAITEAFFPPGAETPRVDFDVRIRPSPRIAIQTFSVGGQSTEYHNGPEEWVRFSWPGEDDPGAGAVIEIRGEGGIHERIEQQGEWGLFHLLEEGTVVSGAGSPVFTVVWHLRTYDVDVTIDFRPVRANTPFFGGPRHGRDLMSPLRGADIVAPREIVSDGRTCQLPRRGA